MMYCNLHHVIMNILVVSKNNKLAHSVLQAINIYLPGNELITACNSHECLNINQTHAVDIFIIDLDLIDNTDYDVFDLIKIIRSSTDTIIMALYSVRASMVKAFNLGATQCISKPFDELELIACIKAILRNKMNNNNIICNIAYSRNKETNSIHLTHHR